LIILDELLFHYTCLCRSEQRGAAPIHKLEYQIVRAVARERLLARSGWSIGGSFTRENREAM
jgi:hypothetical protein